MLLFYIALVVGWFVSGYLSFYWFKAIRTRKEVYPTPQPIKFLIFFLCIGYIGGVFSFVSGIIYLIKNRHE